MSYLPKRASQKQLSFVRHVLAMIGHHMSTATIQSTRSMFLHKTNTLLLFFLDLDVFDIIRLMKDGKKKHKRLVHKCGEI